MRKYVCPIMEGIDEQGGIFSTANERYRGLPFEKEERMYNKEN